MPAESPFWVESIGNISLLPVLHFKAEFARPVREAILALSPDYVAVELPAGLESVFSEAVSRLPQLSYITKGDLNKPDDEGVALWKVEPTDPLCEAVRSAMELEIPVHFIDTHQEEYPSGWDRLPDPYSIHSVGLKHFYKASRDAIIKSTIDAREIIDEKRERRMARKLFQLGRKGRVLFVGGLKHISALKSYLDEGEPPFEELSPALSDSDLKIYHPSMRTIRTLADEIPFMMTLYELQRGGPGDDAYWTVPEDEPEEKKEEEKPKGEELTKKSLFGSLSKLLGMKVTPESSQLNSDQLKNLHSYLSSMQPESWTPPNFEQDGGADPLEPPKQPEPEQVGVERFFTYKNSEQRRDELLEEYRQINGKSRTLLGALDRQVCYKSLIQLAAKYYTDNTGEEFKLWQHRNMNMFSRRYAHLQGKLLPGLLALIYASRACVDHNFAYEFWDIATFYPWQTEPDDNASTFDFDGENLEIGGMRLKHFEFHRTFPRLRQSFRRMPLQERQTPSDDPSDWSGAFESGRICSYPPEDIVIEDYGRYLQKKAIKVQSEAHSRTEPFSTSLLDGIDMRTTLRNWADGQKLYVKEEKKIQGGTGSVVLIFDDDKTNDKYPWCITWHGEHDQESDMAFFATDRRRKVIGPGIARCEYGGLMLSYPPRRLANVWNDPYYRGAKTKSEVLLFAAIDYCQDKHVVYVAEKAPRSFFFQLAQRLGKKLVYLPIGSLSPTALERIRVFHVLAGHRYREIAKNFIW